MKKIIEKVKDQIKKEKSKVIAIRLPQSELEELKKKNWSPKFIFLVGLEYLKSKENK